MGLCISDIIELDDRGREREGESGRERQRNPILPHDLLLNTFHRVGSNGINGCRSALFNWRVSIHFMRLLVELNLLKMHTSGSAMADCV